MKILLLEPFFKGSHAAWARGLKRFSRHEIGILEAPKGSWKWRLLTAAQWFAERAERVMGRPDLFLATDMLDAAHFRAALPPSLRAIPLVLYFHENQFAYPWSVQDRDKKRGGEFHYGLINAKSALASDRVLFSSAYNRRSFLDGLRGLLQERDDGLCGEWISTVFKKSDVLFPGLDLEEVKRSGSDREKPTGLVPTFLWNHRWEFDKNPELFFRVMRTLREKEKSFQLVVLGELPDRKPECYDLFRQEFRECTRFWGYAKSRNDYLQCLNLADSIPLVSRQDFFGFSILEAAVSGCVPFLPRRLSYPELFPESRHESLFYRSEDELIEQLMAYGPCTYPSSRRKELQSWVMRYDWRQVIQEYDQLFESF